mmetsp:Transcript_4276/g.11179  ORF Transcript_4276/g.11179 Transcript_4276/m.11179 type:complete len:206 (+) Transcript_4276:1418-2035(+)
MRQQARKSHRRHARCSYRCCRGCVSCCGRCRRSSSIGCVGKKHWQSHGRWRRRCCHSHSCSRGDWCFRHFSNRCCSYRYCGGLRCELLLHDLVVREKLMNQGSELVVFRAESDELPVAFLSHALQFVVELLCHEMQRLLALRELCFQGVHVVLGCVRVGFGGSFDVVQQLWPILLELLVVKPDVARSSGIHVCREDWIRSQLSKA